MSDLWEKVSESEKEYVEGAGPFTDEHGQASIHGNTIVHKWNTKGRGFLTFFAIFWNAFVFTFLSATWSGSVTVNGTPYKSLQHAFDNDPSVLVFLIFPAIGLGIGYVCAALWFNKTTIKHNYKGLEITRGPVPWPKSKVIISSSDIVQCYVQVYSSHSQNKRPIYAYRVVAQVLNGAEQIVEDGLPNYRAARILEQWLESKLDIEDKSVHGEVAS